MTGLPPLAPGAWRYAAPALVLALPGTLVVPPLGVALALFGLFALYFHRDPDRSVPPAGVVSPADGTVTTLREEGERLRVGVFMSPTDVHVNRMPLDGTVRSVTHRPGAHRPAFSKESERNERVDVECEDLEVSLIAGAFARRIHPYVEAGDELARGDRLGHISFGSRADVLLPRDLDREDVLVEEGHTVRAGETVIAEQPGEG